MFLKENPDGKAQIYLVLSSPKRVKENNINLIREVLKEGEKVLIISINQPAQYLYELYMSRGIPLENVLFIDAITKYAMGKPGDGIPNCKYLNSPGDLTSLSIAVSESLKENQNQKIYLLMDSVNAMLIYLPSASITKFFHFLTSKLKIMNLSGIYLAIEGGLDPMIFSQLTAFSDAVIDLEKEQPE
ncbi:hypothetical protein F1737_10725 [Methanoplanus sp. FWC-SCC4]|uniref:KaiC-like domain-containing protein n=1 Tax=Methanochimaera problematica TaxID=2609417 RepID=A0AA97I561_9EURY|nr:hypothetical protein [Methanoplanus sp. FWC-SCC4]WOF17116.1 hypothetical protein F1737_10725 [Methanoplanus sp. FWC-SCC4]